MQIIVFAATIVGALAAAAEGWSAVAFTHSVVEPQQVWNGHKPKVIGDFGLTGKAGIGIYFANQGFKLYRYPDFTPFLITSFQQGTADEDGQVADINGDGAPDIVIGGYSGSYWLENPLRSGKDPYSSTWTVHHIDSTHPSHDVVPGDINADGKIDIATESGVYLQGNTPDQWVLAGLAVIRRGFQGTSIANLTGDRFLDVVAPDPSGSRLSWFENPLHHGGNPVTETWTEHIIDSSPGFIGEMTTAAFDINLNGHVDVAMAPMYHDGNLAWYEGSAAPRNSPWVKHVIAPVHYVHQGSLQPADFDGNGLPDIAFAEQEQSAEKRIGVFFNSGAGSSWDLQVLATTGGHNLKAGNIGADSRPSLLNANHGFYGAPTPVELWRNQGTSSASPEPISPPPSNPPPANPPPSSPAPTSSGAISINFGGAGTSAMAASETAGVATKSNWNNASGARSASPLRLADENGTLTNATVSWTSDNTWNTPIPDLAGNNRMMRGYLDNGSGNASTVTVSGLAARTYRIYVYTDGDNANNSHTGIYQISGPGITTTSIGATDAPNANFSGTAVQATNSNGNYIVFNSVTISSGFTLTATPGATTNFPRAPVNGIQIVPL